MFQTLIYIAFGWIVGFGMGVVLTCHWLLETKDKNLQKQFTEVWDEQK